MRVSSTVLPRQGDSPCPVLTDFSPNSTHRPPTRSSGLACRPGGWQFLPSQQVVSQTLSQTSPSLDRPYLHWSRPDKEGLQYVPSGLPCPALGVCLGRSPLQNVCVGAGIVARASRTSSFWEGKVSAGGFAAGQARVFNQFHCSIKILPLQCQPWT